MPNLIAEMKTDVAGDNTELVREFVMLPDRDFPSPYHGGKRRFCYFLATHQDLRLELDWLEEMGLIVRVTFDGWPVYRMVPEFVAWLRSSSVNTSEEITR